MAIAAYDSDLTAANGGELTIANNAANWDESSNGGYDDGGTMVDETNFYIQGNECISAQFTKTGVGTIINIQGSAFTVDTDGALLVWSFWASPSSLATYALGGTRTLMGNSLSDFYTYKASGSDFLPNPIGGWANYAIDPASATIDTTVGSPTGVWTHVGIAINATAQSRGNPHAVDAIRVGRCSLEVTEGQAGDYGTFVGMSDFDTSTDQRYELFAKVFGGYKWQGLMSLGTAATAVDFRASSASIFVANTPQVSANFNKIEIRNVASNVEWTSISISAQDGVDNLIAATASNGSFEVVDNATVSKTSCIFTDMNTFVYKSNSTLTNSSYIRCAQITQDGAILTGCTIDESTATSALLVSNLSVVTNNKFNSSGTGYAVDLGTYAANASVSWGNLETGYVSGTGGTAVDVTPTGNETILCNVGSGFTLTINVATGGSTPSVANSGAGSVDVVASFTLTLTDIPSGTNVTIVNSGTRTELQHSVSTGVDITYSHGGGETVDILLMSNDIDPNLSDIYDLTLPGSDSSIKFQTITDTNYDNPA